jgi:hypothetical protein
VAIRAEIFKKEISNNFTETRPLLKLSIIFAIACL